jgi:hypothetical protein
MKNLNELIFETLDTTNLSLKVKVGRIKRAPKRLNGNKNGK